MYLFPGFIRHIYFFIPDGNGNERNEKNEKQHADKLRPVFLLQRKKYKMIRPKNQDGVCHDCSEDKFPIESMGLIEGFHFK